MKQSIFILLLVVFYSCGGRIEPNIDVHNNNVKSERIASVPTSSGVFKMTVDTSEYIVVTYNRGGVAIIKHQ